MVVEHSTILIVHQTSPVNSILAVSAGSRTGLYPPSSFVSACPLLVPWKPDHWFFSRCVELNLIICCDGTGEVDCCVGSSHILASPLLHT